MSFFYVLEMVLEVKTVREFKTFYIYYEKKVQYKSEQRASTAKSKHLRKFHNEHKKQQKNHIGRETFVEKKLQSSGKAFIGNGGHSPARVLQRSRRLHLNNNNKKQLYNVEWLQ